MTRNDLQDLIIRLEFEMFQAVSNRGGRASCQDDQRTFTIMRKSQFDAWSVPMLESYLEDLTEAQAYGRNLLSEKYAWMMRETFPEEFEELRDVLIPLQAEQERLVDAIMQIQIPMAQAMYDAFPAVCACGRPLFQNAAHPGITSSSTYLRGELCTYSSRTLTYYLEHLQKLLHDGRNLPLEILENTARQYGYQSLADREAELCTKQ